ncbi:hypothetical protein HK100_002315 [Physocladia obscura]|uniref:Uncharacterized protein n=1 Tax=Physocladia obscura TaxID=109957 RepID=A0AAD5XAB9_9FUNG|nr:hypothetical protein HK100_002315 [Physocladia obscura]
MKAFLCFHRTLATGSARAKAKAKTGKPQKAPTQTEATSTNFERTRFHAHHQQERKPSSFVDMKVINAISGSGGDGSIHFFKGLANPMGPPCGGNGGRGGDVWITASREVTSLGGYRAPDGERGGRQNMHGKDAPAIEIVVPIGTQVRQVDSLSDIALRTVKATARSLAPQIPPPPSSELLEQEEEEEEYEYDLDKEEGGKFREENDTENGAISEVSLQRKVLEERELEYIKQFFMFRKDYLPHADRIDLLKSRIPPALPQQPPISLDLNTHGDRCLLVRGGRHGYGNPHFASNEIRGPGIASFGEKGTSIWLELELKTIADAGLVGLPNAGKSTLLKRITNATPKIASYPFTTLNPYVGTIEYSDSHSITIADIPGLVSGAHMNVGLGHEFLRHIERSNVLVYVVDLGALDSGADFLVLRDELERYKSGLSARKRGIVVANKADLGEIARENLRRLKEVVADCYPKDGELEVTGAEKGKYEMLVVPVSARDDKNINVFLSHLRKLIH